MRIMILHDFSHLYGGGEVYIQMIKEALENEGHIVRVVAGKTNLEETQISDRYLFSSQKKIIGRLTRQNNIIARFQLKKEIGIFKPDVIHIQSLFYNLSPSILKDLINIPTLLTIHNYIIFCGTGIKYIPKTKEICKHDFGKICFQKKCISKKEYFFQNLIRKELRKNLQNVDLFIPCSTYGEKLLIKNGYSNCKLVHHGIKTKEFFPSKIPLKKTAMFIGRLEFEKGIDLLIKAFNDIIIKYPDAELLIVGEGPEEKFLKSISASENIKFVGKQPRKKINQFYKDSCFTIIPSIWPENSPIVIYESLALGRPVIGTRVGGIPDLIDHNKTGLIIEPNNKEEIKEAIEKLFNNRKKLELMSDNARKEAIKRFDMNVHIKALIQTYKESIEMNKNH